jgi:hypothetical protein
MTENSVLESLLLVLSKNTNVGILGDKYLLYILSLVLRRLGQWSRIDLANLLLLPPHATMPEDTSRLASLLRRAPLLPRDIALVVTSGPSSLLKQTPASSRTHMTLCLVATPVPHLPIGVGFSVIIPVPTLRSAAEAGSGSDT